MRDQFTKKISILDLIIGQNINIPFSSKLYGELNIYRRIQGVSWESMPLPGREEFVKISCPSLDFYISFQEILQQLELSLSSSRKPDVML